MKWFLILFLVVTLGACLRISNISVYKFYPDAYQNLLVAQNIKANGSVVGYMGEGGLLFPPYIMWSRPVYPLFINVTEVLVGDSSKAAALVALLAGVLAIPVSFLFLKNVFGSKLVGLAGASVLAISFNHSVWGGFILTETVGILMLLSALFIIFANLKKVPKLLDARDLLAGLFLAVSIFTRYEYTIVLLPISLFVFSQSKKPFTRLASICVAILFVSSLFLSLLFPVSQIVGVALAQLKGIFGIVAIFTVFALVLVAGSLIITKRQKAQVIVFTSYISIWVILVLVGFIAIPTSPLSGLRTFFRTDFILGIFALVGIVWMLLLPKFRLVALFVIFSSTALGVVYFSVNPEMQRYGTHLIPFLLVPAGFALSKILRLIFSSIETGRLNAKAVAFLVILMVGFGFQIFLTRNGMRSWDNGDWYRQSYEEKAAKIITSKIEDKNTVLIVSFPEAYYYFSKLTTQSIADTPPYIYLDHLPNEQEIVIVLDMGMRDIFPNFSKVLEQKMQHYKPGEFWVGTPYRYLDYAKQESFSVTFYETTAGKLKEAVKD